MSKHKSEDYKLSAVKYYLNNSVSLDVVCEIFDCPKQSLSRWVKIYEELEEIKRLTTDNTKAIIVVHLFGKPISEIGEIVKYCLENKIKLIEDCAQAHGAKIHDKKV